MDFQQDVIDRLARLEVNQTNMDKKLDLHLQRHYEVSLKSLFAFIGAGLSLLISIFK
jgi:hypothetical protein